MMNCAFHFILKTNFILLTARNHQQSQLAIAAPCLFWAWLLVAPASATNGLGFSAGWETSFGIGGGIAAPVEKQINELTNTEHTYVCRFMVVIFF